VEYCNKFNLNLEDSVAIIKSGLEDKDTMISILKKELKRLEGDSGTLLFKYWDKFIKECKTKGLSTKALIDTKAQFNNYLLGRDMFMNDINREFLNNFSTYKLSNGCNKGGLDLYLRTLRRVYLAAQKIESLNIKQSNPFTGYIGSTSSKEIIQLTPQELRIFSNHKPKYTAEKALYTSIRRRDILLFQFYIGGHDFVDVALLTWSNYRNGRLRFRRFKNRSHKNGGPLVDNLVLPQAKEIIDKYGTKDKDRIFSFIPSKKEAPQSYDFYINNTRRTLRNFSKQAELKDTIKTKSTRYIFKTWADEKQLDNRAIRQIQGHEQVGISSRYGARLPNNVVDSVLQIVVNQLVKGKPQKI